MDNALFSRCNVEVADSELVAIRAKLLDHRFRKRVGEWSSPPVGGDDMVHRGKGPMRVGDFELEIADHRKSLWARDLMNQMRADKQLRLPVGEIADGMCVPDFLEECFTHSWRAE